MGFAGSHRLDERRRRRLASDPVATGPVKTRRVDAAHGPDTGTATSGLDSPVLSLLPEKSWQMIACTVTAAVAAGVLLWGSVLAEQSPRWVAVFGIQRGSALPFATCLLMLGFAQLSAVVYWYRKRSRRDFAGKYRRWFTAAAVAIVAACCQQTGCHEIAARELSATIPPATWNTATVCWVVPAAVVLVFLAPALLRELRAFGVSSTLFALGTLALIAALALPLVGSVALRADTAIVATRLTLFAAFWCLVVSIWWHARHVVRVSNEPPPTGQIGAELKRFIPKPKLAFLRRKPKQDAADQETVEDEENAENASAPTKRRKRKPQPDSEPDQQNTQDASPGIVARLGAAIASPFRKVHAGMQARSASRAEARELKRLEREEKKAAKLKAAEDRKAAKLAAIAARDAEKAKAREERVAAKAAAADAKKQAKVDTATAKSEPADVRTNHREATDSDTATQQTAAERRAARKAARAERRRSQTPESEIPAEMHDDFDQEDERQPRRKSKRKKSRR